jgi:hypothetical protein
MSVAHVTWAFKQKLPPTRKFVLVALADRCNKDTLRCDPCIETLMKDTCLGERAVRQALSDLCEAGILTRYRQRRRDGSWSQYRYQFPKVEVRVAAPPAAPPAGSPAAADAGKPEVVLEPEELLAAAPQNGVRKGRPRNDIWDALETLFGPASTRSAQTGRGKVVSSLTAAGATPDEIFKRAKRWALHFDHATLTDHALEKHWDTLPLKPRRIPR